MKIEIFVTQNYGVQTAYPHCEKAKHFAAIAKTKTLTTDTIANIKKLGYAIEVIEPKYNF